MVPQGGGDALRNHRCPGEGITIALLKETVTFLTSRLTYQVPVQDLELDMSRAPALPRSGFVLSGVRRVRSSLDARDADRRRYGT